MAFGLRPIGSLSAAPFTQAMGITYSIASGNNVAGYASNILPGDLVTLAGDANTVGPTIALATASNPAIGVFWGLTSINKSPPDLYSSGPAWLASTVTSVPVKCFILTDPNIIYQIQTGNGSGNLGLVSTNVGSNANILYAAGTVTATAPLSGTVLNLQAIATTDTHNLKIWGLADLPGNVFYAAGPPVVGTGNIAVVTINNHITKAGVTGI